MDARRSCAGPLYTDSCLIVAVVVGLVMQSGTMFWLALVVAVAACVRSAGSGIGPAYRPSRWRR